jgi:hypothetical protein
MTFLQVDLTVSLSKKIQDILHWKKRLIRICRRPLGSMILIGPSQMRTTLIFPMMKGAFYLVPVIIGKWDYAFILDFLNLKHIPTPTSINIRKNCTLSPCDFLKLQIVLFSIKINSEILVVSLIYKLLPRIKFY